MVKNRTRLGFFGVMLTAIMTVNADTIVKVDLNSCEYITYNSIVCGFILTSPSGIAMSLTAGPYSQGVSIFGEIYDSSRYEIANHSGMAVGFDMTENESYRGKLFFENVDTTLNTFKLLTMRLADGVWQSQNMKINAIDHSCLKHPN